MPAPAVRIPATPQTARPRRRRRSACRWRPTPLGTAQLQHRKGWLSAPAGIAVHGRDHRDASRRVEPARGAPRTAPGRRERRPWRAALGSSPASPHDRRPGKAADDRPANRSRSSSRGRASGAGPVSARGPNRLRPRNRLGVTRTAPRAERGFKCAGSRKGRWACVCVTAETEAQSGAPFKPCKTASAGSCLSPIPYGRPAPPSRTADACPKGPSSSFPDGPTGLPADPAPVNPAIRVLGRLPAREEIMPRGKDHET